jgi:hypothetical protein
MNRLQQIASTCGVIATASTYGMEIPLMPTSNTPVKSTTVPKFSRDTGIPAGVLRRLIGEGRIPGIYSGNKAKRGRFYINIEAAKTVLAPMVGAARP